MIVYLQMVGPAVVVHPLTLLDPVLECLLQMMNPVVVYSFQILGLVEAYLLQIAVVHRVEPPGWLVLENMV